VDLVVLTGSAATGRKVLAQAARSLTPAIVELSGCDAVVVLRGADHSRVAAAINFGLSFNGGATCLGPRRLIIQSRDAPSLLEAVVSAQRESAGCVVHPAARADVSDLIERAIAAGAVDLVGGFDADQLRSTGRMRPVLLDKVDPTAEIANADLFAPVISIIRVAAADEAVPIVNQCRYRLAASVFGPTAEAMSIAAQLDVGAVTVNDLIAPTADPRLPFGGRGQSGFGVTRGREGLLAMTTPKVTCLRRGRFLPHLDPRQESDDVRLGGMLRLFHADRWRERWAGLREVASGVKTSKPDDFDSRAT
jgi:aldehyde dehydrogenase (NAD+)